MLHTFLSLLTYFNCSKRRYQNTVIASNDRKDKAEKSRYDVISALQYKRTP